jgi:hypothetical protein
MALKFKFKTKAEIPAEHLPHYAERDGAWVLDVDGAVDAGVRLLQAVMPAPGGSGFFRVRSP